MSVMFRLVSAIALAGVVAVGVSFAVRAQDGPGRRGEHGDRGDRAGGRVTAIGDRLITVSRRDGSTATIAVTDGTQFKRNGAAAQLADFQPGDFVFARGAKDANGQFVATEVMGGDKRPERRGPPN